ncbi:MAG: serine hydrolase domain-containing protein [Acidimicrobiales bacterium]
MEPATTSTANPAATTVPPSSTTSSTTAPAGPDSTVAESVDLAAVAGIQRPISGSAVDHGWDSVVASFDQYVIDRDIGAAVLAVAVDGAPVLEVALGWADLDRTEPLTPEHRFRLASVTKPYTRALAFELQRQGRIDLERRAFCTPEQPSDCVIDLVDEAAAVGRPVREEMAAITIRQLLDHTAGFDSNVSIDPMFAPLLVRADLGLDRLPLERDVATWILGEPLVHQPGEVYAYSNVGYLSAGLAIEETTGSAYLDLLHSELGVSDRLILGSSLPSDRADDEVEYACDEGTTINLFDPTGPPTCWADGGFYLEAMTAHGRLVAPASEVLSFLAGRCIDGFENMRTCDTWHDGSLSGTYTVARNVGRVDYVVLFNQRSDPGHDGFGYTDVVDLLDDEIQAVVGDLFAN